MTGRITNTAGAAAHPEFNPDNLREDLGADEYFELLGAKVRALYPEGISDERCHAATYNLIGFGKLLLEMKRQIELDEQDE